MPTAERRATPQPIPREITRPCSRCKGSGWKTVLNGEFFGALRKRAKLTLEEMARICRVSVTSIWRMEHNRQTLLPKYAFYYDRLLERRQRAGEPS